MKANRVDGFPRRQRFDRLGEPGPTVILRLESAEELEEVLIAAIAEDIPHCHLNGHPQHRLANNTHFRFDGIEGESILLALKDLDISVSTGSACSSKTLEPSHTLIATGLLHEEAHGSLQLTCGRFTKESDLDQLLQVLPGVIENLRKLSPLYRG